MFVIPVDFNKVTMVNLDNSFTQCYLSTYMCLKPPETPWKSCYFEINNLITLEIFSVGLPKRYKGT